MTVIIAIAEGMELSVLREPARREALPWFNSACESGHLWQMDCGPAPYEPSNLTTAFTGLGRGFHGCYSYWAIRSDDGGPPPVLNSSDVRVVRFWNWSELKGVRVALVNVQLTYPPQPINGCMLSYLMHQSLRYSFPPELAHDLRRRGLRYSHDVSVFYKGESAEHFFSEVMRVATQQLETAVAIAAECDLLVVNLTLVDRLSHFQWRQFALWDGTWPRPFLWQAYEFVDAALALLDDIADPEPLLVFSEEGFGPLTGFVSLEVGLQAAGLLRVDAGGESCDSSSIAREAVQGSHGVVLLRHAAGSRAAVSEVRQCLEEMRGTDGLPLVSRTWAREDLYEGPMVHLAPEIIVEPADPRKPPLGDPRWANHVNRHLQTGWHRDRGFVLVQRATALVPRTRVVPLETIAPTAAALLGRAPNPKCTASPLATRSTTSTGW